MTDAERTTPSVSPPVSATYTEPHPRGSIWRERDFVVYCIGNAVSFMGNWAQRIAIGWLSWQLTESATWVGCIALAQYLPLIVLGPFFGVLLDRHERRGYALLVNAGSAVLAALLWALTALGWMSVHILLVLAIATGVTNSAYQTARLTLVNDLVGPENVGQAIAVNSILFNLTRALGPAAAGIVIAHAGIASAFAANAVSFVGIIAALCVIKLRPSVARPARKGMLSESREAFVYTWRHPLLRQLFLLSAITAVSGRGCLELLPAFSAAVFHRGSTGLAQLNTAIGVGAIVGALILSQTGTRARLAGMTRCATLALGLILMAFAICRSYPVALLILAVFGVVVVLCSVGLQTILQSGIKDHYRGRVVGLWGSVNVAGPGVGAALLGALSKPAGLTTMTVMSGLLCCVLVFSVIGPRRFPFG